MVTKSTGGAKKLGRRLSKKYTDPPVRDGFNVALPNCVLNTDTQLPLPPYKLFSVEKGVMRFRLHDNEKWKPVWKLDNDTAFVALCIAHFSLAQKDADPNRHNWIEWFRHHVERSLNLPATDPEKRSFIPTLNDEQGVLHDKIEEDDDLLGGSQQDCGEINCTFNGRLEASPTVMADKLKPEDVRKFTRRANMAVRETVWRAAEEIDALVGKNGNDKKFDGKPPATFKWVEYALRHIPSSVLVEIATGPAMQILNYRAFMSRPDNGALRPLNAIDDYELQRRRNAMSTRVLGLPAASSVRKPAAAEGVFPLAEGEPIPGALEFPKTLAGRLFQAGLDLLYAKVGAKYLKEKADN